MDNSFKHWNGGENWNDITSNLPKSIEHFNQIVLTNTTVYVATDKGVFSSIDGVVWHTITDEKGKGIIIKSLATAEDAVYGANDDGIHQFENKKGIWKQIVPQIPDVITSLVVDGNTFFVSNEQRGVLRFERSEAQ